VQPSKLDNYNSPRGAQAYKSDYEQKLHRKVSDRIERRIFARFFARLGRCRTVLDLPCGAGRLFDLLQSNADHVLEADWSITMLDLDRKDHDSGARGYLRCSALEIPLPDRAVDVVVSVRLSHHFDAHEDRLAHLRELFRVADRGVIVTFFSHHSLKNVLRRVRAPFDGKTPKNTLRTAEVVALAAACGFTLVEARPLSRLGSGHVFALLERRA
jgi:ubiquinone/menaquinone biosynthesis C-methylase UbiE